MLLSGIDTHSRLYLEYRDIVADLADHLGSAPTAVQRAIIEEASGLVIWCRKARLALLKGEEFNVGTYTTATNALRRLLGDIGQEALLKDVTPGVEEYCASPEHKLASAPPPEMVPVPQPGDVTTQPEVAPSTAVEAEPDDQCEDAA